MDQRLFNKLNKHLVLVGLWLDEERRERPYDTRIKNRVKANKQAQKDLQAFAKDLSKAPLL